MPYSHFSAEQIIPLMISGILLISSILTFKKHSRLALILLFLGSLGLGYFMANLDHFLILWDEQYHALVAKNLSKDFLKPTLYSDPLLPYDYENWTQNYVWLHKQPLFLWQMALSVKLFGASEFAIRLPSILMHAIIPLFIYRIGKISINKVSGFYGALFFALAYFPLELVVGRYSTDHNDVAFLFYVTASFWAWFEYTRSQNRYWLILIGLFSGCAVLVKWLMGLLIFVVWTFTELFSNTGKEFRFRSYLPIALSGLIGLIVFLPWQMYIHWRFPKEAAYEMALNQKHFFEPIENHRESTWFHFTAAFKNIYGSGDLIPFIFLLAVILLLVYIPKKEHKIFIGFAIGFVYLFYTLAQTKMISFTIIVSPLIYLALGFFVFKILDLITQKIENFTLQQAIIIPIVIFIAFTALNLSKIENYHTHWKPRENHGREGEELEMKFIQSVEQQLQDKNYVIFNVCITHDGHIPMMFYTDFVAYNFIPNPSQIDYLRKQNKKIAVLNWGNIPEYILEDSEIKLLESGL